MFCVKIMLSLKNHQMTFLFHNNIFKLLIKPVFQCKCILSENTVIKWNHSAYYASIKIEFSRGITQDIFRRINCYIRERSQRVQVSERINKHLVRHDFQNS